MDGLKFIVLAQEHGAEEPSGVDLILPETAELVWGIILFAVVLVVLWKVAFPGIRKAIEERQQTIQNDLEAAENAKQEANKQLEDYKKQVADARGEANRIIEEARQSAENVRKDLIAKAEQEAQQVTERAQEQILAERNRTVQELQQQIADLSIELASKVVGRSLEGDAHRDLVDAYIKEVAGMGNGGARSN